MGSNNFEIDNSGFYGPSQGAGPYSAPMKPWGGRVERESDLRNLYKRWSWLSQHAGDRPWEFSPKSVPALPDPEMETPTVETRAVRIAVIGRASARWRDAKSRPDADRRNEELANRRADNVRAFVEQIIRNKLPNTPILPGTSPGPGQTPTGLQVGAYGVGSRQPSTNAGNNPQDDDPRNRTVQVMIELTTTKSGVTGVSRVPRRIDARTDSWYGKGLELKGGAAGVAGYQFAMRLRNPLSGKSATYTAFLKGGGVGVTMKSLKPWTSMGPGDFGDEFSFTTPEAIGFGDFDGQEVRVERASAGLGIGAAVMYLTFVGLGRGAATLSLMHSFGLSKPSLEGSVTFGALSLKGPNPGDWYEVDGGEESIPFTNQRTVGDGIVITFPTGKSEIGDVKPAERDRLRDFVTMWAQQV
jgi:hypothetical protein